MSEMPVGSQAGLQGLHSTHAHPLGKSCHTACIPPDRRTHTPRHGGLHHTLCDQGARAGAGAGAATPSHVERTLSLAEKTSARDRRRESRLIPAALPAWCLGTSDSRPGTKAPRSPTPYPQEPGFLSSPVCTKLSSGVCICSKVKWELAHPVQSRARNPTIIGSR